MKTMWVVGVVLLGLVGCGGSPRGPYVSTGEQLRDPALAEQRYREAVALLADKPSDDDRAEAEQLFRAALGFDLYHGPAHNNLGVLLLNQDRLYDAAEEFEWARKLLPGNPEPRVNMAIALERGGKHVEAIEAAKTALEVAPGNLAAMQTIALVQVREGMQDTATPGLLAQIRQRSDDAKWTNWSCMQEARHGGTGGDK